MPNFIADQSKNIQKKKHRKRKPKVNGHNIENLTKKVLNKKRNSNAKKVGANLSDVTISQSVKHSKKQVGKQESGQEDQHKLWARSVLAIVDKKGDDIKKNLSSWIKHISQALNSKISHLNRRRYVCLAATILDAATGGIDEQKSLPKVEYLPAVVKAMLPLFLPSDQDHHWNLSFLNILLRTQPGAAVGVKEDLEDALKAWLDAPLQEDMATEDRIGPCAVQLAGSAWAKLPVTTATSGDSSSNSRIRGLAVAKGQQLRQLSVTLNGLLDEILTSVICSQNYVLPKSAQTSEPLTFIPIKTKSKTVGGPHSGQTVSTGPLEKIVSGPLEKMRLLVVRSCNLLTFIEMMLLNLIKGTLAQLDFEPSLLLLPILRILQVSTSEISRYNVEELKTLALLWPMVQERALNTLHLALNSIGTQLLNCSLMQTQITEVLLATSCNKSSNLVNYCNKSSNLVNNFSAVQGLVSAAYQCLATLIKLFRGKGGCISLPLAKRILSDLSIHEETVKLKFQDQNNLSNMNIKKKSKKKGYSVVDAEQQEKEMNSSTSISLEKSALIVDSALEVLQSLYDYVGFFNKDVEVAKHIQEGMLTQAWKYSVAFGRTLGPQEFRSVSGIVDLKCLLQRQRLFAKFLRVLGTMAVNPFLHWPFPAIDLLRLLEYSQQLHSSCLEIRSVCQQGTAAIRLSITNPKIASFHREVENTRHCHLSSLAESSNQNTTANSDEDEPDVMSDEEEQPVIDEEEEEDPISEEEKEDPISEDQKEDPISEEEKEDDFTEQEIDEMTEIEEDATENEGESEECVDDLDKGSDSNVDDVANGEEMIDSPERESDENDVIQLDDDDKSVIELKSIETPITLVPDNNDEEKVSKRRKNKRKLSSNDSTAISSKMKKERNASDEEDLTVEDMLAELDD